LWGATAFAADPQLMILVMPNAKVLAGVNVTSAKNSLFGQFVLARIAAQPIPAFITATGFDPRTDLTELLFASAADPSNPGGLALARGTFNVDQIVAAAANHQNLAVLTYDGDRLIADTNPKAKVAHSVAFIGSSIAVAGDLADVKAALDRNSGANSIDPALAAEVNTLSTNNDAWIASSAGVPGKKVQALQAVQSFEGGLAFGANVQVTGQAVANSPQNAAALASVMQLLVAASANNAAVNQLLQSLQVSVTNATLNLALTLPEPQVESVINGLAAQRQQAQTSGPARVRPPAR
jgi:hypothetical protein